MRERLDFRPPPQHTVNLKSLRRGSFTPLMKLSLSHSTASVFKHSLTTTFVSSNDKMKETELETPQTHSQPKKFTAWFVHSLNEVESLR